MEREAEITESCFVIYLSTHQTSVRSLLHQTCKRSFLSTYTLDLCAFSSMYLH